MKNSKKSVEDKEQFAKLHGLISVHLKADGVNPADTDAVIAFISQQEGFPVELRCEMSAKFALVTLAATLSANKLISKVLSGFEN